MSINKALENILEGKLDEMRQNFSSALTAKAVEKLEERKIEIAQSYFGQMNESDLPITTEKEKTHTYEHKKSGKQIVSTKHPGDNWKKINEEEQLDEKKKASDRVVTASKKAKKGTKWRVMARNADSEGSDVELRQGKRRKMAGGFYRDTQEFGLSPTKKGKMTMGKGQWFNSASDILKTVKE